MYICIYIYAYIYAYIYWTISLLDAGTFEPFQQAQTETNIMF